MGIFPDAQGQLTPQSLVRSGQRYVLRWIWGGAPVRGRGVHGGFGGCEPRIEDIVKRA